MKDREREIAAKILERLKNATAPGKGTWGDNYPEAHADLFKNYSEDMVEDIAKILRANS